MESQSNAPFAYQATQISTATKEQLLLITYDIGIRSCRLAETALEEGEGHQQDLDLANREIIRAQDVIRELMVTLNTTRGGEMAQSLMRTLLRQKSCLREQDLSLIYFRKTSVL